MNNTAAIGYMILAAKELGFPQKEIEQLAQAMNFEMDISREEEAEEAYRNL